MTPLAARTGDDRIEHGVQRGRERSRGIEVAVELPGIAVAEIVESFVAGQGAEDALFQGVIGEPLEAVVLHGVAFGVEVLELVTADRTGAHGARPGIVGGTGERGDEVGGGVVGKGTPGAGAVEGLAREAVDAQEHVGGLVGREVSRRNRVEKLLVGGVAAGSREEKDAGQRRRQPPGAPHEPH